MPRRIWLAGLLVLLGVAPPAEAQTKIEWQFKEGEKFYQEIVNNTKLTMKNLGQEINRQQIDYTMVASFTVLQTNRDAQTVILDQKIETLKLADPKAAGQVAGILQQMPGCTFRITFGPNMRVMKFGGYEDMVKKIAGPDQVANRMVRVILSEDALRKDLEEVFGFVPGKPVSTGEKWERRFLKPLGAMGTLSILRAHTYVGMETVDGKSVERIAVAPTITFTPPPNAKGDLKTESARGLLLFDANAGKLALAEMSMRVKVTLLTPVMGNNLDIELDMEQSVKIRGLDKNPLEK